MSVTPDRWTCPEPTCRTTVLVGNLPHDEAAEFLRQRQAAHARRHKLEAGSELAAAQARA